jgi:hypothetical protein
MTVREIYSKYQIMPQLEDHMLRVTRVADLVMDGWKKHVDKTLIIKTCLFHDLGNIVKFNLDIALDGVSPISPAWKKVQQNYIQKFGSSAHVTTIKICRELKALDVIPILEEEKTLYEDSPTTEMLTRASTPALILMYADMRVMPKGISAIKERANDLHLRYKKPLNEFLWLTSFEQYIANQTDTDLQKITDQSKTKTSAEYLDLEILGQHP